MFKMSSGILVVKTEGDFVEIGEIKDLAIACEESTEALNNLRCKLSGREVIAVDSDLLIPLPEQFTGMLRKTKPKPEVEDWQGKGKRPKPRLK